MTENINNDGVPDGVYFIVDFDGENLEVIEKHEHSGKVPYIQEGKDAAISYGSYDFKFKNNYEHDIKIYALPTTNDITIRVVKI